MRQASSIKTRDRSSLYQTPAHLPPSLTRAVSPSNERRSIRHSYGPASETAPWHSATNSSYLLPPPASYPSSTQEQDGSANGCAIGPGRNRRPTRDTGIDCESVPSRKRT